MGKHKISKNRETKKIKIECKDLPKTSIVSEIKASKQKDIQQVIPVLDNYESKNFIVRPGNDKEDYFMNLFLNIFNAVSNFYN
jgi:hypothetical protein